MKKITLLLLSLCITLTSYAQFPEDFGGGTIPAGWAVFDNGNGTVESWQVAGTTDPYAVIVWENVATGVAEDWLVTPQFTVDGTNFILSFDQSDSSGIDYGSVATIRVSTASQTAPTDFTIVDTQTEADLWAGGPFAQHTVDLSAYIGQAIYVAFVMTNDDGDLWAIDNIDMIADATAPNPATTPTPADMAMNIAINDPGGDNSVTLSWAAATTGDPATAYDVYYGTDADPPLLGTISNTTVDITGNDYSTLYFWKIVAKNVGGEAVGSEIWEFTTEADPLSVDEFEQRRFTHFYDAKTDVLNLESSTTAFSKIEIFSILGTLVKSQTLLSVNESIDISQLTTGTYIGKVEIGGNTETIKFIKN